MHSLFVERHRARDAALHFQDVGGYHGVIGLVSRPSAGDLLRRGSFRLSAVYELTPKHECGLFGTLESLCSAN